MDRKGFIHVVEIVVISLVVFILVLQFSAIPSIRADWDRTKLAMQGNDLLFSLDRSGVNWLNSTQVGHELSRALEGTNINYRVSLENAIKPDIEVACICTEAEADRLEGILTPFTINGGRVEFDVFQYEPSSPIGAFTLEHDVMFLGETFLSYPIEQQLARMNNYLAEDKGMVLEQDLENTNKFTLVHTQLFGLQYDPDLSVGLGNISFATEHSGEYYNIEKYFLHIPGLDPGWQSAESPLDPGERVMPTNGEAGRIVMRQAGTGTPAVIANSRISQGMGRTAWFSRDLESPERAVLLKSLLAWAAGETYDAVPGTVSNPSVFTLYKVLHEEPNPMAQPVKIVLSMGYIF